MKTIKQLEQEIEFIGSAIPDEDNTEWIKINSKVSKATLKQTIAIKEMIENLWIRKNINVFDKLSQEQVSWNNALDKILIKINGGEE